MEKFDFIDLALGKDRYESTSPSHRTIATVKLIIRFGQRQRPEQGSYARMWHCEVISGNRIPVVRLHRFKSHAFFAILSMVTALFP